MEKFGSFTSSQSEIEASHLFGRHSSDYVYTPCGTLVHRVTQATAGVSNIGAITAAT